MLEVRLLVLREKPKSVIQLVFRRGPALVELLNLNNETVEFVDESLQDTPALFETVEGSNRHWVCFAVGCGDSLPKGLAVLVCANCRIFSNVNPGTK